MTPPAAVRDLALRLTVTDPLVLGRCRRWPSWESVARAAGGRVVILDLSGVTRMDRAGLGWLAAFAAAVRARGGCVRLAHVQPRLLRMIEATGFLRVMGRPTNSALSG